jgi:hypothetical protein
MVRRGNDGARGGVVCFGGALTDLTSDQTRTTLNGSGTSSLMGESAERSGLAQAPLVGVSARMIDLASQVVGAIVGSSILALGRVGSIMSWFSPTPT